MFGCSTQPIKKVLKENNAYMSNSERKIRLYQSGKMKPWNKGKKWSEMAGENNPSKRPEVRDKISKSNTGKKRTPEQRQKLRDREMTWGHKVSKTKKRLYKEGKIKPTRYWLGKKRDKDFVDNLIRKVSGENHYNWKGGKSFELYDKNFNNKLKKAIKERDGRCMMCKVSFENLKLLKKQVCIHHIDYNKQLSIPQNCISLCRSCHTITTNCDRNHWTKALRSILSERYGYRYTETGEIILEVNHG